MPGKMTKCLSLWDVLPEAPGTLPPQLQFQGIHHNLLASTGTRQSNRAQGYTWAKHMYSRNR